MGERELVRGKHTTELLTHQVAQIRCRTVRYSAGTVTRRRSRKSELDCRDVRVLRAKRSYSREQRKELVQRKKLYSAVRSNSHLADEIWKSVDFFYELRNSLYYEVASPEITDSDIEHFRKLVATVLRSLHGVVV